MQLMVRTRLKILTSLFVFVSATFIGCKPSTTNSFPSTVTAEVINPLNESRKDVAVFIPLKDRRIKAFTIRSNEMQLAGQNIDSGIFVVLDSMKANEKRWITIYYNTIETTDSYQVKRTQAIGSAWESEKVGYFIDQSSVTGSINILGKRTADMMLMGIDREPLSLGPILWWTDSVVAETVDGNLFSAVSTNNARLSITAGSRWTHCQLKNSPDSTTRFFANIITHDNGKLFQDDGGENSLGYIATFDGELGRAVIYRNELDYYFGAAWKLEPMGITSETAFANWVEKSARELANPVVVNVK
jgi:hypothetical protein